ncbi:type I restriction enzyme S subunit [Nocardioides luteus]|nr:type I restriction enzyme S subunit [Nocardioides luteus]
MAKVGDISRAGRSGAGALVNADHFVDESDLTTLKAKPIPAGAVLFAKIGEAIRQNHRVIAGRPLLVDNNAMAAIPRSSELDARYLYRFLQSVDFYGLASSTTVPSLRKSDLVRVAIPLPSLDEQRRIATILDQADAIRIKRRQVLTHLDTLTQSTFHDMFAGHEEEMAPLADLAVVTSGITKGRRTAEPTFPTPYLAVSNVQAGHLKMDVVKEIEATTAEIDRYALKDGDLVLTEGGDPDKLGRGTVWRSELPLCLHQNHVFRVRSRSVEPDYLAAFMASRSARSYFLRAAKQTTGIASINMTQLKALPVLVPSGSDQSAFVERMKGVESQRVAMKRAIAANDELFASLQARAFNGSL